MYKIFIKRLVLIYIMVIIKDMDWIIGKLRWLSVLIIYLLILGYEKIVLVIMFFFKSLVNIKFVIVVIGIKVLCKVCIKIILKELYFLVLVVCI